jgi:hypothetical protein
MQEFLSAFAVLIASRLLFFFLHCCVRKMLWVLFYRSILVCACWCHHFHSVLNVKALIDLLSVEPLHYLRKGLPSLVSLIAVYGTESWRSARYFNDFVNPSTGLTSSPSFTFAFRRLRPVSPLKTNGTHVIGERFPRRFHIHLVAVERQGGICKTLSSLVSKHLLLSMRAAPQQYSCSSFLGGLERRLKIDMFHGELQLHIPMPALEDGCTPQMEMAAENVAATEEAEALTARH